MDARMGRLRRALVPVAFAVMAVGSLALSLTLEGCGDGSSGGGSSSPAALMITTTSLPHAYANQVWAATLTASGGATPYLWQATGMPAWMQLDAASGLLAGVTPTGLTGSEVLFVTVQDALGATDSRSLTLTYASGSPPQAPIILPAVVDAQDGHFSTHLLCATCHSNSPTATAMRDNADRDIAPANLWRATMMANSFRDPYFRAVLASEMDLHSAHADAIQDKCLTCHASQAAYEAHHVGAMQTLAEIYAGNTPRAQIGLDGVSCTLCHQVEPTNLGTPASFTGKFTINTGKLAFGPHANPFAMPMTTASGYTPTHATHLTESKLCGSCHTLHTNVLDLNHNPTGASFPEQTPYLEWRNSVYSTEVASPGPQAASCQSCHMPTISEDGVPINTRIARQPGGGDYPPLTPRQPFGRHILVGGNTIMLSILRDNAADLNPAATTAEFNKQIELTRHFLENSTAEVAIQNLSLSAGTLEFDVLVTNKAGHKLPTAYPSRRAWLRVLVKDAGGNVVWRSGDYDAQGRIVDGAGNPLPLEAPGGPIEPHHQLLAQQHNVQIYEAVHADVTGTPTFSLLFANSYYKDNRLLPLGWSNSHPDINDIAPAGVSGDADFIGGSDTVKYQVGGLAGSGYTVEAELLFQTIAAREASELFTRDHIREVNVFRQYFQAATRTPERLASDTAQSP
jgi:hypothetical protein